MPEPQSDAQQGFSLTSERAGAELQPRKRPRQARSTQTVETILDASVLVLMQSGMGGFTTTRVAERAGVSVGSLYQYFPNRESVLHAALDHHLQRVISAVETACRQVRGKPLLEMTREVIQAFLESKFSDPMEAVALYGVAADGVGLPIVREAERRAVLALSAMFETASDGGLADGQRAARLVVGVLSGAAQSLLAGGHHTDEASREDLSLMICQYLAAIRLK